MGKSDKTDKLKIYNMDCMDLMKQYPDKFFDLVIADPPYGINGLKSNPTSRLAKYGQLKTVNEKTPTQEFFNEIKRVSKNQIVFGMNYFTEFLPPTKEFIFWYKHQPVRTYADGELIWTSFNGTAKCFDFAYYGSLNADKNRIHPTQKPIILYGWLLANYAKPDFKILDTHLGSGSSAIACHYFGAEFVGCELDEIYYKSAIKRIKKETSQLSLFEVI